MILKNKTDKYGFVDRRRYAIPAGMRFVGDRGFCRGSALRGRRNVKDSVALLSYRVLYFELPSFFRRFSFLSASFNKYSMWPFTLRISSDAHCSSAL